MYRSPSWRPFSGVSSFQLVRGFSRVQATAAAGFSHQSHMTSAFARGQRRAPGRYHTSSHDPKRCNFVRDTPARACDPCVMIRRFDERDFAVIWSIINDGARAYENVIPADCWTEPYMSREDLQAELQDGILFWVYEEAGSLQGVMGIQDVDDVTLIRHAYVRSDRQRAGIGGRLLSHLRQLATSPILIGTWADAGWAIRFYQKHGFRLVSPVEKQRLLTRYWKVSDRQAQVSVVMAEQNHQQAVANSQAAARWERQSVHVTPGIDDVVR